MANYNKPHNFTDISGQKFGRWTVLTDTVRKYGRVHYLARCECGVERIVAAQTLRNGKSVSCGCINRKSLELHGLSRNPAYQNWVAMIQRCTNPHNVGYRWYGARGVAVCEEWRESFAAFYKHMGDRPDSANTVDRIDGTKGYEPGNCRWASQSEQTKNQRHPPADLSNRSRDPKTGRLIPNP